MMKFISLIMIFFGVIFSLKSQTYDSLKTPYNCIGKYFKYKKIYTDADKLPEYINGDEEYSKLFTDSINVYPKSDECQTKFYLIYVIDSYGNVTNKCLLNTTYKDRLTSLEKQTLNILNYLGKWIPAERKGKKVPFEIRVPIFLYKIE